MPTPLHIQLLGEFRLSAGASPLTTVASPRLQALLAYLLLHHTAPQPRRQVAFLLWPDSGETQALTNLRSLVLLLRRALPDANHYLRADRTTLHWAPEAPWHCDLVDVERAFAAVQRARAAGDEVAKRAALEAAVTCYHGELLPGCYDEWLLPVRDRLHRAYVAALDELVPILAAAGDLTAALAVARRLVEADPLHEDGYCHLMRLQARHGDLTAVRRAFRDCTTVLQRELGAEPSPATRATFERLLVPAAPPPSFQSLPVYLEPILGRDTLLLSLRGRLTNPTCRLLTLTGPGGVGKSRLAVAVAAGLRATFADGIVFVSLAPITDPALVASAIAQALAVTPVAGQPLVTTLLSDLAAKRLLLLLDNFEHVQPATSLVADILAAGPGCTVLATSRAPLHLAGEHQVAVPPLAVPTARHGRDPALLRALPAVQLFVARAQRVQPAFGLTAANAAAVAEICVCLDGLPLALELAAAWIKLLTASALLARLDHRLALLGGVGQPAARFHTLRDTIAWSYQLLDEQECALFTRLAVFVGGCTVDAIEQVVGTERHAATTDSVALLRRLYAVVDMSLLQVQTEAAGRTLDEPRFAMLETIRAFGLDQLQQRGDHASLAERHAHYYCALALRAEGALLGLEQWRVIDRLDLEHANLRAALTWLLSAEAAAPHAAPLEHRAQTALQMAVALSRFWLGRAHISTGRALLEAALRAGMTSDNPQPGTTPIDDPGFVDVYARAHAWAGWFAYLEGAYTAAREHLTAGVHLLRDHGSRADLAQTLWDLGLTLRALGLLSEARACEVEAHEHWIALDQPWALAKALAHRADEAFGAGDGPAARALTEQRLSIERALANPQGTASALLDLALFALAEQRDLALARTQLQESLERWTAIGFTPGLAGCLKGIGWSAAASGRAAQGSRLWGAAAEVRAARAGWVEPQAIAYEHVETDLRRTLGEATFRAAWEAGRALSVEQAVAEALQELARP